jgi:hypothetical protein
MWAARTRQLCWGPQVVICVIWDVSFELCKTTPIPQPIQQDRQPKINPTFLHMCPSGGVSIGMLPLSGTVASCLPALRRACYLRTLRWLQDLGGRRQIAHHGALPRQWRGVVHFEGDVSKAVVPDASRWKRRQSRRSDQVRSPTRRFMERARDVAWLAKCFLCACVCLNCLMRLGQGDHVHAISQRMLVFGLLINNLTRAVLCPAL